MLPWNKTKRTRQDPSSKKSPACTLPQESPNRANWMPLLKILTLSESRNQWLTFRRCMACWWRLRASLACIRAIRWLVRVPTPWIDSLVRPRLNLILQAYWLKILLTSSLMTVNWPHGNKLLTKRIGLQQVLRILKIYSLARVQEARSQT